MSDVVLPPTKPPVETKVKTATAGAAAGTVVSDFVLWGLDQYFWLDGPPQQVTAFTYFVISTALAFIGGWWGTHDSR
jgi:hypothetical protein